MRYRRRGTVEAVRWTGANQTEVKAFAAQFAMFDYADTNGDGAMNAVLKVKVRDRIVAAEEGDYVVRGERGDFLLVRGAEFERDWEAAERA